jgi:hypothetical protein
MARERKKNCDGYFGSTPVVRIDGIHVTEHLVLVAATERGSNMCRVGSRVRPENNEINVAQISIEKQSRPAT